MLLRNMDGAARTTVMQENRLYLGATQIRVIADERNTMTTFDFDKTYDRVATRSSKWTLPEKAFGISGGDDLLPMWVADMDFTAPSFLTDAVQELAAAGDFGYFAHVDTMFDAIKWWMDTRHGWKIETDWITPTVSLGNAIAMTIQTWSKPGDAIAIFTPVYHEFAHKIGRNNRTITELPLKVEDNRLALDFERYEGLMTGKEKMLLLSSPHNPAGRVWTVEELRAIAAFCERHDLLLVSDEVHHDLILNGHTHVPTAVAVPEALGRMIVMTSASKTFSIAGSRLGTVTIPDPKLRQAFKAAIAAADIAPNVLGVVLTRAAYSPAGAAWVDGLCDYLTGNAKIFEDGIATIPGVTVMPLEGTYLSWLDFTGTGMSNDEIWQRVTEIARIAPSPGLPFGTGGAQHLRINLGTQRARVSEAIDRLQKAFADLQ